MFTIGYVNLLTTLRFFLIICTALMHALLIADQQNAEKQLIFDIYVILCSHDLEHLSGEKRGLLKCYGTSVLFELVVGHNLSDLISAGATGFYIEAFSAVTNTERLLHIPKKEDMSSSQRKLAFLHGVRYCYGHLDNTKSGQIINIVI